MPGIRKGTGRPPEALRIYDTSNSCLGAKKRFCDARMEHAAEQRGPTSNVGIVNSRVSSWSGLTILALLAAAECNCASKENCSTYAFCGSRPLDALWFSQVGVPVGSPRPVSSGNSEPCLARLGCNVVDTFLQHHNPMAVPFHRQSRAAIFSGSNISYQQNQIGR